MLAVLVNAVVVLLGGLIGLVFRKGLPERFSDSIMKIIGAFALCIGMMGVFKSQNNLVMLISAVLGTVCGEMLDIDAGLARLGGFLERRFHTSSGGIAQGFITSTLLFCVGAMSIVGSIEAGSGAGGAMLYAKSVMDGISAIMLASTLGVGVLLTSVSVLMFEGVIALLAGVLAPVLTEAMLAEIIAVGSLLIVLMGFNTMSITKTKVANMLPAILWAPFVTMLFSALGIG